MPPKRSKPMSKRDQDVFVKYGMGEVDMQSYETIDFEQYAESKPATHDRTPASIRLLAKYNGSVPQEEWSVVAPGSTRILEKRAGKARAADAPIEEDEVAEVVVRAEELSSDEELSLSSDEHDIRHPQPVEWKNHTPAQLESLPSLHFMNSPVDALEELDLSLSGWVDAVKPRDRWATLMQRLMGVYYRGDAMDDRSLNIFSINRGVMFVAMYMAQESDTHYRLLNYFHLNYDRGFQPQDD